MSFGLYNLQIYKENEGKIRKLNCLPVNGKKTIVQNTTLSWNNFGPVKASLYDLCPFLFFSLLFFLEIFQVFILFSLETLKYGIYQAQSDKPHNVSSQGWYAPVPIDGQSSRYLIGVVSLYTVWLLKVLTSLHSSP